MKSNSNNTSFNDMTMKDKLTIVEDYSTELCSIEYYDHRIYLYAINDLMIEAYHNITTKEIEKIVVAEYHDLDKFLPWITLSSLLKKVYALKVMR
jgi:hypothetical protein